MLNGLDVIDSYIDLIVLREEKIASFHVESPEITFAS